MRNPIGGVLSGFLMALSSRPSGPETPLRFEFQGYSIWLELEQIDGDLDLALDVAAKDLHVHRIPGPHVTVEYGMTHLSEAEMQRRFVHELQPQLHHWPCFRVIGILTDATLDGVDGENMSMAWIEMTLRTSQIHEDMVDLVRGIFFDDPHSRGKWKPHLSVAYENPEQAQSNLHYSLTIVNRVPTLTSVRTRRVTGIALWSTAGTMDRWKCLKRFALNPEAGREASCAPSGEQF